MSSEIQVVIFERDLMPTKGMSGAVWATQQMGIKTCVAAGKQSSRLLLHVVEKMGADPWHCATVCSGSDGVAAGRRAGVHVIAYAADREGFLEAAAASGASVIDELRDLPELLRVMNSELTHAI